MTRVALLDRDGTINVKAPEGEYVVAPDEVELLPGAATAIRRLNAAGVPVAVVTNQRGIALGRMSESDLAAVHERLAALLAEDGARIDLFRYCPHAAGTCHCRKPEPGMLVDALETLGGTPGTSIMIGDSASDIEAGHRAGVPTARLGPGGQAPSLLEVTERWLGGP